MVETMQRCTVAELNANLTQNAQCQIIDVREYSEFAAEHIPGTKLVPLSSLEQNTHELDSSRQIFLLCRSGNRASLAANKLAQAGFTDLVIVDGGIQAWRAAGLPINKGASKVWSLERQVRFTAGSFVLTGVLLALFVHPYFIALSGFIGAGLVFSAVTDTCGMGMILAKMPWNQKPQNDVCEARSNA